MLNCISTSDWIQIGIGIITAIGIIIAITSNIIAINSNKNQLVIFNKQLKLNFFADYTKRYQEIILNFPENINTDNFSFDSIDKETRNKTLRYMRAYFDLCSEEFHLNENSYIDADVWEVWEGGIKYALTKKAFRDAWIIIKADTKYKSNFHNWIDMQVPNLNA